MQVKLFDSRFLAPSYYDEVAFICHGATDRPAPAPTIKLSGSVAVIPVELRA